MANERKWSRGPSIDTANMGIRKNGRQHSQLNGKYYTDPKTGFDQQWHEKQAKLKAQKEQLARQKAMASIKANKAKRNIIT